MILGLVSLAAKLHEDTQLSDRSWAILGGVSKTVLIEIQAEVLELIDCRLFVSSAAYLEYYESLRGLQNL